jgi:hypothetical protein
MTFGNGREDGYHQQGDKDVSIIFHSISNAAVTQMLLISLILGGSTVLFPPEQQKLLLAGQSAMLFVSMLMLAGDQGGSLAESQRKAGVAGTFGALVLALLGAY